jgi:hypothetical protein
VCTHPYPNIFRVIRLRRMKWAGQGEIGYAYTILFGKPKEKSYLGNIGVDGMIILKWIL